MSVTVASLHSYPIKSCRAVQLDIGIVQPRGFHLDRRFMVVDADGAFRTQRRDPALARVDVSYDEHELRVSSDEHGATTLDLAAAGDGPKLTTTVWRHTGPAVDQGDEAAAFFTDLLGAPSRLVYMADDVRRPVNQEHAASAGDIVGFADGYPFLVTNNSSLADLQQHMDEQVPMGRFRANIVVDGAEAWAEDSWAQLRIGDVTLLRTKACTRCTITTTDQRTGLRNTEPLVTLGKRRRTDDGVTFGMYFVPADVGGRIRVGDSVVASRA